MTRHTTYIREHFHVKIMQLLPKSFKTDSEACFLNSIKNEEQHIRGRAEWPPDHTNSVNLQDTVML